MASTGKGMLWLSKTSRAVAVALFGLMISCPARAALSQSEIVQVEAAPAADAHLPGQVSLTDEHGKIKSLRQWLDGKPTVWVLADYTCKTLCGPVIGIVADALDQSGLRPGQDYRYMVVGLDPKDTIADASAMKQARIGGAIADDTHFFRASPQDTATLLHAFGFQAIYDRANDQFAHPAAAFVVTPQGRIAFMLAGLALLPSDLRLALVSASQGRVGSLTDHIRLLCYGFDPARGVYAVMIGRVLAAAGAVTATSLALFIAILLFGDRRSRS
jgi:protein SCO1/2